MPSITHLQDELSDRNTRSLYLIAVLALLFFVLILRLVYLQVIQADVNIRLSKENSMRLRVIVPPGAASTTGTGRCSPATDPRTRFACFPPSLRTGARW